MLLLRPLGHLSGGRAPFYAPRPGSVPYTATKHGVVGLMRTFAVERIRSASLMEQPARSAQGRRKAAARAAARTFEKVIVGMLVGRKWCRGAELRP